MDNFGDLDDNSLDWLFSNNQPKDSTVQPASKHRPTTDLFDTLFLKDEWDPASSTDAPTSSHFDDALSYLNNPNHVSLEDELNQLKMQALGRTNHSGSNYVKSYPSKRLDEPKSDNVIIDEYEEADYGDAYDNYSPAKLKLGQTHPDQVVESSSLSVVSPPDITYELSLPDNVINEGMLSSLQLESVIYACQKHEDFLPDGSRAGYLIGDGPGVGKGRIISGIIYENMLKQRTKAVWISVSSDLRFDANRDLEDIGCDVCVYPLNKIPYTDSIDEYFEEYNDVGILFSTYSSLIGESHTISDAIYRSRIEQILDWLTPEFSGLIIFDECHKAKNLMPSGASKSTKTAQYVLRLQMELPKARIVYCSATGASEPRNMAYMVRLGLWGMGTPFSDFECFLGSVEKRGVGAMELVAIDMKQRGVYLARQLSFTGVSFNVKEVAITQRFKEIYDESVKFWDVALGYFEKACDLLNYSSKDRASIFAQFFSSHQRFFKSLCIASKIDEVVDIVKKALRDNKAVVIGLQSTGESGTFHLIKDCRLDKIVSTTYGIITGLLERHFPMPNKATNLSKKSVERFDKADSDLSSDDVPTIKTNSHKRSVTADNESKRSKLSGSEENALLFTGLQVNKYDWNTFYTEVEAPSSSSYQDLNTCQGMLNELEELANELEAKLPANTLDLLIDKLGGPDNVAEMTGRKSRIVSNGKNAYVYESRSSDDCALEYVNIKERDSYMDGQKLVAIISEAASSGISLQADKRVANKRRRLHITLELSWSADRVIQQFGRSHRSNQLYPPEYLFVISELAGEKRFASAVAKRLESLGALTHGDRRATETRDLSQFNIDNKYGRYALDRMLDVLNGRCEPFCELPPYSGSFLSDSKDVIGRIFRLEGGKSSGDGKEGENVKIHKFLNRLLGVKVDLQNAIYQFYVTILDFFVKEAQLNGKYDFGIIDMGLNNEHVVESTRQEFVCPASFGRTVVHLLGFNVERGIGFEAAKSRLKNPEVDSNEGFYMSRESRGKYRQTILVLSAISTGKKVGNFYTVTRANTGFGNKKESIESIMKNYYKVSPTNAQNDWVQFYNATFSSCAHEYFNGQCNNRVKNGECDVGKRVKSVYLLCGAIFSLWNVIENTFGNSPIRMARVTTRDGVRRIGILIPKPFVKRLVARLQQIS